MKKQFFTFLAAILLAGSAVAEEKAMDHSGHGSMDHKEMSQDHSGHGDMKAVVVEPGTEATGIGVLNSIDTEKNSVNITHEPMPDLGWPKMTMDLQVTKHVDLSGFKAGDNIDFKLKLGRDKQYRVVEMEPAKQ